jgi:tRNA(adenine34) deaminase
MATDETGSIRERGSAAMRDERFMRLALEDARVGGRSGEVPVGAVLVIADEIVARGYNQQIARHDPTAHAEIIVLREAAARIGNYRVRDAELFVTVEPCLMCVGALVHARVSRVVFGAPEPKTGALGSTVDALAISALNHRFEVTPGVLAGECRAVLQEFFRERRAVARS